MFFFETYHCFIWIEIAIRKGSTAFSLCNVDCSTLQTSWPNPPHTHTHIYTNTQKQESVRKGKGMSQSKRYVHEGHNHSVMHSDISHTTINMFFFKTYIVCTIWSEIAIRKGSSSTICNVDCSTLQTSRANHQPHTHTQTHTNNSQSMHAFMHSIHIFS